MNDLQLGASTQKSFMMVNTITTKNESQAMRIDGQVRSQT